MRQKVHFYKIPLYFVGIISGCMITLRYMLYACNSTYAREIIPIGKSCKEKMVMEQYFLVFLLLLSRSNLNSLNIRNRLNLHN